MYARQASVVIVKPAGTGTPSASSPRARRPCRRAAPAERPPARRSRRRNGRGSRRNPHGVAASVAGRTSSARQGAVGPPGRTRTCARPCTLTPAGERHGWTTARAGSAAASVCTDRGCRARNRTRPRPARRRQRGSARRDRGPRQSCGRWPDQARAAYEGGARRAHLPPLARRVARGEARTAACSRSVQAAKPGTALA